VDSTSTPTPAFYLFLSLARIDQTRGRPPNHDSAPSSPPKTFTMSNQEQIDSMNREIETVINQITENMDKRNRQKRGRSIYPKKEDGHSIIFTTSFHGIYDIDNERSTAVKRNKDMIGEWKTESLKKPNELAFCRDQSIIANRDFKPDIEIMSNMWPVYSVALPQKIVLLE
jgi:hypothetical protein